MLNFQHSNGRKEPEGRRWGWGRWNGTDRDVTRRNISIISVVIPFREWSERISHCKHQVGLQLFPVQLSFIFKPLFFYRLPSCLLLPSSTYSTVKWSSSRDKTILTSNVLAATAVRISDIDCSMCPRRPNKRTPLFIHSRLLAAIS